MTTASIIAVNRFGLGGTPGEALRVKSDPRGWLQKQVRGERPPPETIAALPSSLTIFREYQDALDARGEARQAARREAQESSTAQSSGAAPANDQAARDQGVQAQRIAQSIRRVLAPKYAQQVAARYHVAGTTEEPLRERLIHFWTNHFAVSSDKVAVLGFAGALENEAIRPNVAKRFVDMLLAVERHPGMILYLDNQQSIGPNSEIAAFAKRRGVNFGGNRAVGINENLAREILELHTLGVSGGYAQSDVTTFAQALTGWGLGGGRGRMASGSPGEFVFRTAAHEPGAKVILGKRYAEEGEAQARTVLEDLSKHPATAKFVATKLVRHFVSDEAPASAVDKVTKAFRDSGGDLPTVHAAVIELSDAWQEPFAKFKTPHEFVIATFRALTLVPSEPNKIAAPFELLGQRPYTPGSPAGWPDIASQWDGPDALMKRIEWSTQVGQRAGTRVEPLTLAESTLGDALSDHTRVAISRAASGAQAVTLLLMSPEFQRR